MDQEHDDQADLDRNDQRVADECVRVSLNVSAPRNTIKLPAMCRIRYGKSRMPVTPMINLVVIERTEETPSGRHVVNSIRNGLTQTNSERYDSTVSHI